MEIFLELAGIVFIATLFSILMRILRQPLIVGYILAGIFIGPYFLNIYHSRDNIELFSKIGVTILLFILGLNLSPRVIKEVGKVSFITGAGEVIFSAVISFGLSSILGFNFITALFIALALSFSSTIIVLKLLSDKNALNKLYGRISIGFLLLEDIAATILLVLIASFSQTADANLATILGLLLLKAGGILLVLYLVSEFIMPRISIFMASSTELLFLFSMTWGLGLAALFHILGFSIEIGALIAGIMLSLTPFSYEIESRMKPLRDFFIVLFFVLLGSQMVLGNIFTLLIPVIVLSFFVLFGRPVIVLIIMNLLGYKKRTSFMAGITITQISEFSLILTGLALSLGYITKEISSLITLVGLITIGISAYLIMYSEDIYVRLEKLLGIFEIRKPKDKEKGSDAEIFDILLFGYDRVGQDFLRAFSKLDKKFLVIDFDPSSIKSLQKENIPYRYGDAQDIEFVSELNLAKIKMAVSTIPDFKTNMLLVNKIKEDSPSAIIIVISHDTEDAQALYEKGATYVIMPHYLGARFATNMISKFGLDKKGFEEERDKHLEHLEKRKEWTGKNKYSTEEKAVDDEKSSK
ncbi:MAG: cation:proton antiporter [Patescibacteria group bacterium]